MASKRNFKAIAILLVILPFAILFPLGYYLERGLPYTDDDYCDLCNAPSEWIITRTDNGVTYPVHEFCERDAYICFFSVTLIMNFYLNLTIPDYAMTQTHFNQASVFLIYYCSVAFYLLSVRRKIRQPVHIQSKQVQVKEEFARVPTYRIECPTCNSALLSQNNKWYCPKCLKWYTGPSINILKEGIVRPIEVIPHKMNLKDAALNAFEAEGDKLTMNQIVAYIYKHRHEIEDIDYNNTQALREVIFDLKETGKIRQDVGGTYIETEGLDTYSRVRTEVSPGLPPQPPPPPLPAPPEGGERGVRNATIGAGAVILMLFISVLPILPVPSQSLREHSEMNTLFDEFSSVSGGYYIYYSAYIDLEDPNYVGKQLTISGDATETSGSFIDFYVFDEENYNLWREGYVVSSYVSYQEINTSSYHFSPDHSDTYYLVFDNTYSNTKTIHLTAIIYMSEWVTVTETEYESLLQILLSG